MTFLRRLFGVDSGGTERAMLVDSAGRQFGVLGEPAPVVGNLSAVNQQVAINVAGMSSVGLYIRGTFGTSTAVFEQSPDSTNGTDGNWFPLTAARSDSLGVASTTPLNGVSSATNAWVAQAPNATWVRFRVTVIPSGTIIATLAASASSIISTVANNGTTSISSGQVTPIPALAAGLQTTKVNSAASTNAVLIKATTARIYGYHLTNLSAATKYVKFYNKATAPTVGTDATFYIIAIPAGQQVVAQFPMGQTLSVGMGAAITNGVADTDTTAVAVNDVVGWIAWI